MPLGPVDSEGKYVNMSSSSPKIVDYSYLMKDKRVLLCDLDATLDINAPLILASIVDFKNMNNFIFLVENGLWKGSFENGFIHVKEKNTFYLGKILSFDEPELYYDCDLGDIVYKLIEKRAKVTENIPS